MIRRACTVGLSLLLVATLGACGSSKKSSSATSAPSPAATTAGSATGGVSVTAAAGTPVEVTVGDTQGTNGPETLQPSTASVKAGTITFTVKNTGTIDHEMVVLKTDTPFDQLAIGSDDKISEENNVGETGDPALKAGETRSFSVDLAAGKYVLVCNIAKHYGLGMRAAFTVS
jgi:uncharacterized cupredoxin-like copper-binding protein